MSQVSVMKRVCVKSYVTSCVKLGWLLISVVASLSASLLLNLVTAPTVQASEVAYPLQQMTPNLRDLPSLQRGARVFVNYCAGCHSLKYQRYEKTADFLGIPHDVALDTLIFTDQKIGGLIETAMPAESNNWFGVVPPDLTMVTRVRGTNWVYTYLKTFYADDARPLGVNNLVFHNVGMPHVLQELQGLQHRDCSAVPLLDANGAELRDPLVPGKKVTKDMGKDCDMLVVTEKSGLLDAKQYDQLVYDLVNFLAYVGEPAQLERRKIGTYVLIFLVVLFVFAYLLGREYGKDWH